jgi:hypothetical protein
MRNPTVYLKMRVLGAIDLCSLPSLNRMLSLRNMPAHI